MDDIGLETPNISQGFREFPTRRCKRRCDNEQLLIELWKRAGEQIDEQRLRIFRLLSPRQQADLLEGLQLAVMKDPSRIPADATYLQSLGRAVYNFTYLEWGIVWTISKLSNDGFASVPKGETARAIAKALTRAIENTTPILPAKLRIRLIKLDESFRSAITDRNKLFHAHPFTAVDGSQQLGGGGLEWPIEKVQATATKFEELAIECNAIFHGPLKKERP